MPTLEFQIVSRARWSLFIGICCGIQLVWFTSVLGDDDTNNPSAIRKAKPSEDGRRPDPQVPSLVPKSDEPITVIPSFKKPAGWSCKLFAAEPMMGNPVVFAIDNLGRVMVCESYRQGKGVTDNRSHDSIWLQADLEAKTVADRIRYHRQLLGDKAVEYETYDDVLRLLVDTDGDYVADSATVFASGFNGIEEGTGAGALIRGNRVYYTNIPKLWSLTDTDGDGVADERQVLADGFGVRVAFRGHDMHGLILGPDGRLYFSIGDRGYHVETPEGTLSDPESGAVFRCEQDGSHLEVFATGLRNPQELAFDDFGNLFTGDNNSDSGDKARWVNVVRGGDSGWRMMYQYISDRGPFNREKIWLPYSSETPAYIVPPIANIGDGPSGLTCYPGTGLGAEFQNSFLLCDFRGQASNSGIRHIKVEPRGAFFEVTKNEQLIWNILATDADFGPDGGLYVSDWVNGWNGENKGRIYRFANASEQETALVRSTAELLKQGMTDRALDALEHLLSHADRRVRLEAQWELANRNAVDALSRVARDATQPTIVRLHGVWGLGQLLRKNYQADSIVDALGSIVTKDRDEMVIAKCIEAIAAVGSTKSSVPTSAILMGLRHESPIVRAAACMAAGTPWGDHRQILTQVVRVLEVNQDRDPILRHAGIMALAGVKDPNALVELKDYPSQSVRLAVVVALRKQQSPLVAEFLRDASESVVKEAVRAIHDVPSLHSRLPQVADLILETGKDDAVVRRVLNGCFRLGGRANAQRLASFASGMHSDAHRIEALNLLATWDRPGKNDRIMNRYLPLADRDRQPAIDALRERLPELSDATVAVRDRFLEIAASFGILEIRELLEETVRDAQASGARRGGALRALASLAPDQAKEIVASLILDSDSELRMAALDVQSRLDPSKATVALRSAVRSPIVRERQYAWDLMGNMSDDDSAKLITEGVESLMRGDLVQDTWINVVDSARLRLDATWKEKLDARQSELDLLKEKEPAKSYADCIDGGEVDRGRELFFTRTNLSCVRCHKVGSTGGEVGPNLSDLGSKKTSAYLLEAIVAPNLAIAQGFETVIIQDDDGQIHTGILKSEDESNIQIMDSLGVIESIPTDSVTGRRKGMSSMPGDLTRFLSRRELRDLVAYLKSLDGTPDAIVGFGEAVDGHKVE